MSHRVIWKLPTVCEVATHSCAMLVAEVKLSRLTLRRLQQLVELLNVDRISKLDECLRAAFVGVVVYIAVRVVLSMIQNSHQRATEQLFDVVLAPSSFDGQYITLSQ